MSTIKQLSAAMVTEAAFREFWTLAHTEAGLGIIESAKLDEAVTLFLPKEQALDARVQTLNVGSVQIMWPMYEKEGKAISDETASFLSPKLRVKMNDRAFSDRVSDKVLKNRTGMTGTELLRKL